MGVGHMNSPKQLTILTPIFENRAASKFLFADLFEKFGAACFVVAVDDGSVRDPVEKSDLQEQGLNGVVIRLRRNVGHQRAIAVGLNYVADHRPDYPCVVMDSDGEDRVATIELLQDELDEQQLDAVVAARKSRVASVTFRVFYVFYTLLFGLMTGQSIRFGNFMILSPKGIKRLVAMNELWIHIAACLLASKLRVKNLSIARGPRYSGQSKMNFSSLALHGLRAFMVFAEQVLVRVGIACAAISVLSVIGMFASVSLKFMGLATPGWFSISLGVMLLVLLQTGALTLMSLMMTGIIRDRSQATIEYQDLIDDVLKTNA